MKEQILAALEEFELRRNTKPSQFQIFKGRSAMRLQLDVPRRVEQQFNVGCLYLQVAPVKEGATKNNRTFDWENRKISSKINVSDISQILYALKTMGEVNLFHEFNGDTKTISFTPKSNPDGYFLTVEHRTSKGDVNKISVPLSMEEVTALAIMLQAALPKIHNWEA